MQYRRMGRLDWEVSALGFGAMRLPTKRFNKLAVDHDEAIRIIRRGIDLGINYVDTAWFYHVGDSRRPWAERSRTGTAIGSSSWTATLACGAASLTCISPPK